MVEFILALAIITIIFISNKYFQTFCAAKLKINIYFDDNKTVEEKEVKLNLEVINRKFLIIPIFKIDLFINRNLLSDAQDMNGDMDDEEHYTYTIISSLLSYQRLKKSIALNPVKRGYYRISANVTLIDLFGLSKMRFNLNNEAELFVAPMPKNIDEYIDDSTSMQGNMLVKRWIAPDPIFYSGVRPYDVHDSFRDIDWKATAKLGEFYVKKYDFTSDPSLMIFIDVYSGSEIRAYDSTYIEKAISFAASLADYAYKNKLPVGLGTNSYMKHYVKNITFPDMSRNNIMLINDMLTCMEYKSFDTFKNTMDKYIRNFTDNNIIVFIKHEISPYLYNTVKFLSSKNYKVYVFLYKENDIKFNDRNVKVLHLK